MARTDKHPCCPHCDGTYTERLPGGIVHECLDCGFAFNLESVTRYVARPELFD